MEHIRRVRRLYKTVLRLHRGLPEDLKVIGNSYVKDEFKRHKKCNPAETVVFMDEWTKYAVLLSQQLGLKGPKTGSKLGRPITREELDFMSDQQIEQLYELMLASMGEPSEMQEEIK